MIHLDDALVRKTTYGGAGVGAGTGTGVVAGVIDGTHPHNINTDPLTTKSIAEALELTHTSSSAGSSGSALIHHSHGGDMYPWKVSLRGILTLIIHETNRSDKEYRLSAARALSFLPWVSISGALAVPDNRSSSSMVVGNTSTSEEQLSAVPSAGAGMSIFDDYFEQLAALAGIPPYYAVATEEMDNNTTTTGSITDNKALSSAKTMEKKGSHQPRGNALFGSRYGIDFNQKRNTLVNRRVTTANVVAGPGNDEDMMLVTTDDSTSHETEMQVVAVENDHDDGSGTGTGAGELSGIVQHESEAMMQEQATVEDVSATTVAMDVVIMDERIIEAAAVDTTITSASTSSASGSNSSSSSMFPSSAGMLSCPSPSHFSMCPP